MINFALTFDTHRRILISEAICADLCRQVTLSLPPRILRVKRGDRLHGLILSDLCRGPRRRAFRNPLQNRGKNKISPVSTVVSKSIFIEIGLQIVLSYGVIDSANSGLQQHPESLDSVGVNVAN